MSYRVDIKLAADVLTIDGDVDPGGRRRLLIDPATATATAGRASDGGGGGGGATR